MSPCLQRRSLPDIPSTMAKHAMPSSSSTKAFRCFHCRASKPTSQGLTSHIRLTAQCRRAFNRAMAENAANIERKLHLSESEDAGAEICSSYRTPARELSDSSSAFGLVEEDSGAPDDDPARGATYSSPPFGPSDTTPDVPDIQHVNKRARVEEVPDERDDVEDPYTRYSPSGLAGPTHGEGATF